MYDNDWKGWGDWLGTGTIAPQNREYLSFEEARKFVRSLGLKNMHEWSNYAKSGSKPQEIPANPIEVYENSWISSFDWLGVQDTDWSLTRVKELLKGLIDSNIISTWDEAVLYSLLLRKGLLNLSGNCHESFFKNLIQAASTKEGRKTIEEYADSDLEIPPDLSTFIKNPLGVPEEEIQTVSDSQLTGLVEESKPFDYQSVSTTEQILSQTNILESISVDEEAMQFYLDYSIEELWKHAFEREQETVTRIKLEGKNGNKYHDIFPTLVTFQVRVQERHCRQFLQAESLTVR